MMPDGPAHRPVADRSETSPGPQTRPPTDKLTEIGARVARVAHEMNVPLSLISGSLENLEQYVKVLVEHLGVLPGDQGRPQGGESHDRAPDVRYVVENAPALLTICREGVQRLTHVLQQLRSYTRQTAESGTPQAVDVAALLEEAVGLAGQTRSVRATVYRDTTGLPPVAGVAESLSQAFVNVIGNALDAAAGAGTPQVWIGGRMLPPDRAETPAWVEVRIRDNGPGVPAEHRERIFEPFFTTKLRGAGLGLGLAITQDIVHSHGGSIELADAADGGAEFVIRLPVYPRGTS